MNTASAAKGCPVSKLDVHTLPLVSQSSRDSKTSMYQDKTLVCRDCGQEFIFSAGEQEFFASKGLQNEPGRCTSCRASRRSTGTMGGGRASGVREMTTVTCSACGQPAQVPFVPRNDKPVYCSDCFSKQHSYSGSAR
jgi:CxxC-x17-CxxC domain-containing protein